MPFALDTTDAHRLVVNRDFAPILRAHGLLTFDALWNYSGGSVAKNLLKERTTTRIALPDDDGREQVFFLKRHTRPPFKEYVKPLLRLTWPIVGARNEWDAILRFHEAGIPTMTPAALGESAGNSFLLTAAIEDCRKLSQMIEQERGAGRERRLDAAHHANKQSAAPSATSAPPSDKAANPAQASRPIIRQIARAARAMHGHGLHHQDFYLGHLMIPEHGPPEPLYVIDLGRVRHSTRLGQRWIIKDLAQLNYSARLASNSERLRFLQEYLGRPLDESDRPFLRRIQRKTERIAGHSKKNKL